MDTFKRKFVDWEKTSKHLKLLRNDNLNLRRYVCRAIKTERLDCDGKDCAFCKFEMDNSISQAELAQVFNVSESVVANWENNRSAPSLDDLIFFSQICRMELYEVLVFFE